MASTVGRKYVVHIAPKVRFTTAPGEELDIEVALVGALVALRGKASRERFRTSENLTPRIIGAYQNPNCFWVALAYPPFDFLLRGRPEMVVIVLQVLRKCIRDVHTPIVHWIGSRSLLRSGFPKP
jgi:hypothetical protein